jgi:DNA-binding transcriptional ArsR family regulator
MDAVIKDSKMFNAVVSDNSELMKALAHPMRLKILEMLSDKPMYPIEIARKFKTIEQKIYYHINIMKKAGVLRELEERQMRGGKAKLLVPTASAFGFLLKDSRGGEIVSYADYPPFVEGGVVNARLVVGSPDPHGKSRARSRDGHLASEVSAFFARMGTMPWPFVYEDTELRNTQGNLILLGGPVVNTISAKFNEFMPVQFIERSIKSPEKEYSEDWCGTVCIANNPSDPGKKIIMIAGRSRSGTRAAILGLRNYFEDVRKKGYVIVQGFDEDGDGIVDSVDKLE